MTLNQCFKGKKKGEFVCKGHCDKDIRSRGITCTKAQRQEAAWCVQELWVIWHG